MNCVCYQKLVPVCTFAFSFDSYSYFNSSILYLNDAIYHCNSVRSLNEEDLVRTAAKLPFELCDCRKFEATPNYVMCQSRALYQASDTKRTKLSKDETERKPAVVERECIFPISDSSDVVSFEMQHESS